MADVSATSFARVPGLVPLPRDHPPPKPHRRRMRQVLERAVDRARHDVKRPDLDGMALASYSCDGE